MMVGPQDLLLEEDLDSATRLARAGVPLEVKVDPRAPVRPRVFVF